MAHIIKIDSQCIGPNKPARVLFFGRNGCESTRKAIEHLTTLGCDITYVKSTARGDRLPDDIFYCEGDYIFCFRSLYILPTYLISKADIAAVNFHPAPTEYPGSGCVNFALYDDAKYYGVTAHVMNEKIDNGAILECRRFEILPSDTVSSLLSRTHVKLIDLFFDITTDLVLRGRIALESRIKSAAGEKWRGNATKMKDLEKLKDIAPDVEEAELTRIVRATFVENFPPYITLYGYKFTLQCPRRGR
jgi:methionyl-tRNA formyltransferase